ncbi:MAG TPA: hypothetical protein VFI79_09385 [Gemmatimonadales bacterium]|nr:hypothetical protein [Gemmatimonadales bacterium]
MDPYTFCLLLGALGLLGMSLTGMGRHGHAGHAHPGHAHTTPHAHDAAANSAATRTAHAAGGSLTSRLLWSLMSPRVLFTVLLGAGATGLLLRHTLGAGLLAGAAVAGGVIFEAALVRPVWNASMRFASHPALTLESCVTDPATAVTSFDAHGQGVVAVELDGQMVQVLATLLPAERAAGATVHAGDRVRIAAVDADHNRCTVSLH